MYCKYSSIIVFIIASILVGYHPTYLSASEHVAQTSVATQTDEDACQRSPFLERYVRAGYMTRQESYQILLELNANLHQVDCGTPDCYGTYLDVYLTVLSDTRQCLLQTVEIHRKHYMCKGYEYLVSPKELEIHVEQYFPQKMPVNLSDPHLKKLELRSKSGREALVLERTNFFYFEHVTPQGILRTRLRHDDDHGEDCCWGAISAELRWLHYELQAQEK